MSAIDVTGAIVEFDSPANRVISQFAPKNKFRIDSSLSGIALLRQLSIQGRLRYAVGSGTATITLTPNVGETIFIYQVRVHHIGAGSSVLTITNDGNIRDTSQTMAAGVNALEFNLFDSLVGDNVKTFTVTSNNAGGRASIKFWSENTSRIRDVTI